MKQLTTDNIATASAYNTNQLELDQKFVVDVYNAISSLHMAKDQQSINHSTQQINSLQVRPGYINYLMFLVNDSRITTNMKLAALAQLKNTVRAHWLSDSSLQKVEWVIGQDDKRIFIVHLLENICALAYEYKLIKIVKDIIEIIAKDALFIYQEVVDKLKNCQDLTACLNYLLGVVGGLRTGNSKDTQNYNKLINHCYPFLKTIIQNGQATILGLYQRLVHTPCNENLTTYQGFKKNFEQFLYLSIKLMTKTLYLDINEDIRRQMFQFWTKVSLARLKHTQQEYQIVSVFEEDLGYRGDDRFNYFHSKKWAAKFLFRLMDRWLVLRKHRTRPDTKSSNACTIQFSNNSLRTLIETLQQTFQVEQPERIFIEQLKCLGWLVSYHSPTMLEYYQDWLSNFQRIKLSSYIVLSSKQNQLIEQHPMEFLQSESHHELYLKVLFQERPLRSWATEIWLKIATIDATLESNWLKESISLIREWIGQTDYSMKELACFLLIKLRTNISLQLNALNVSSSLFHLLNDIILDLLTSKIQIFMMRGFEILYVYSQLISDDNMSKAAEIVVDYFADFSRSQIKAGGVFFIVFVKACGAFEVISQRCKQAISLEVVKIAIRCILQVVEEYECEEAMRSVAAIIEEFSQQLVDQADSLLDLMSSWYVEFTAKDVEQVQTKPALEYQNGCSQIANHSLEIIKKFTCYIFSSKNTTMAKQIEVQVMKIMSYLLSQNDDQYCEYQENAIILLNHYLFYHPEQQPLSYDVWLMFRVLVLKITGIHSRHPLKSVNPESVLYQMLQNCRGKEIYNLQKYVAVMRNFIRFIPHGQSLRQMSEITRDICTNVNQTELIYYMMGRFYIASKGLSENEKRQWNEECEPGRRLTTLMLIYLFENQRDNVCKPMRDHTFKIIILNARESASHSKQILLLNLQLFCLWISVVGYQSHEFFQSNSTVFGKVLRQHFELAYEQINQEEQRIRIALGLITYAAISEQHQYQHMQVVKSYTLIGIAIKLLHKNLEPYEGEWDISSEEETSQEDNEEDSGEEKQTAQSNFSPIHYEEKLMIGSGQYEINGEEQLWEQIEQEYLVQLEQEYYVEKLLFRVMAGMYHARHDDYIMKVRNVYNDKIMDLMEANELCEDQRYAGLCDASRHQRYFT